MSGASWTIRGTRIVVTGGGGLIGAAVTGHLTAQGASVVVLEQSPRPDGQKVATEWVEGSILDDELVRRTVHGADALVHLAGRAGLEHGTAGQIYATNALGTFTMLEIAAEAGVGNIVYASSINANGLPLNSNPVVPSHYPWSEDEAADIADAYSLSKEANEAAGRYIHRRYGVPVTGLRYPLVRDIRAHGGALFAAHIRSATAGNPRRQAVEGWSYLDVRDAARAAAAALTHPTPAVPGILVANPTTYLAQDTVDAISRFVPSVPVTAPIPGRTVPLDLTRAQSLLEFTAEVHLEDIAGGLLLDLDQLT